MRDRKNLHLKIAILGLAAHTAATALRGIILDVQRTAANMPKIDEKGLTSLILNKAKEYRTNSITYTITEVKKTVNKQHIPFYKNLDNKGGNKTRRKY